MSVITFSAAGQTPPVLALDAWTPPPCVGTFTDVPCTSPFAPWIEQLARDGVATECRPGRYCPKVPLTREEAAVFLERAMRGTATWPGFTGPGGGGVPALAHTVIVTAATGASGSPDALASGRALLAGLASIPTGGADAPSADNPWLLRVGPGVFDLGGTTLTLRAWVTIEGAGEEATLIRSNAGATAEAASNCVLRRLTLDSSGSGTALRVGPLLDDMHAEQVTLSSACVALEIRSQVRFTRVRVAGGLPALRVNGAVAWLSDSTLSGSASCPTPPSRDGAVTVMRSSGIELVRSTISSAGDGIAVEDGGVGLAGCTLTAAGNGVLGDSASSVRAEDSTISAQDDGINGLRARLHNVRVIAGAFGVFFAPAPPEELRIQGGEISGAQASAFLAEGAVGYFANTVLANGVRTEGDAVAHCAGVVGPGFVFSASACPGTAGP